MYFVYILQSTTTGKFYVGHCDHLIRRFHEHASGKNKATHHRGPWWMPYYEIHPTRSEAMKREYAIKANCGAKRVHMKRKTPPHAFALHASSPQPRMSALLDRELRKGSPA